jgi:hypothetical protein
MIEDVSEQQQLEETILKLAKKKKKMLEIASKLKN